MVSVDQAYMVGHMKNADGSINNKNVVLSAACEAAELFRSSGTVPVHDVSKPETGGLAEI